MTSIKDINNLNTRPASEQRVRPDNVSQEKREQAEANRTAAREDSVSLTKAGSQLSNINQTLKDVPVVNSERVAAIKQAIESGEYKPNSARIAESLVQSEKERYSS